MLKKIFFITFLSFISFSVMSQVGGRNTFEFVRSPNNAFLAGIGGVNISTGGDEANRFWQNPALLNEQLDKVAAFNYSFWQAKIGQATASYAQNNRLGTWAIGISGVNYGEMPLTDPTGADLGTFRANDFMVNAGFSLQQENFRVGANLKWLGSQIESFNAHALVLDIGGIFKHPQKDLSIGLVIKNIGFILKNYVPGEANSLPWDVQVGASFKPEYMPFRFSMTLHHLYSWDIVYLDPTQSTELDANGNPIVPKKVFFDQLARHFVLGGEILLSKNFNVLIGYNHLINREMRIRDLGGFRGFSFGMRLKMKKFDFSYSNGTYHIGAGRNTIGLSVNLKTLLKKKKNDEVGNGNL